MARSMWNGVVPFGMVSIPVKLFAATDSKDLSLHLIHGKCNSRLKQMRWCPVCRAGGRNGMAGLTMAGLEARSAGGGA